MKAETGSLLLCPANLNNEVRAAREPQECTSLFVHRIDELYVCASMNLMLR